jgi:hypothetical protein
VETRGHRARASPVRFDIHCFNLELDSSRKPAHYSFNRRNGG